jgi:hypothetical protein
MLDVGSDHLVASFPDVHPHAMLHVSFRKADGPAAGAAVALAERHEDGFVLGAAGRLMLHLRPRPLDEGNGWESLAMRYPFAVVVRVGGRNAISGEVAGERLGRPQDYFVTPPQGGIDGYLAGGEVRPLVACGDAADDTTPMDVTVMPMKTEAFAFLERKLHLIPGPRGWGMEFTLPSGGGERRCEPLYEDLGSPGDWDQDRRERIRVWLHGWGG